MIRNFSVLFIKGYINIYRHVERKIRKLCTCRYNKPIYRKSRYNEPHASQEISCNESHALQEV